jgi:hypothetical protein
MRFPALIPGILAFGALAVAACATQTPYAPRSTSGYGFTETRIESNRFRVAFSGNSLTDQETVETYLLYRAAELTLQEGYDWFEIVDRDTEANRRVVGMGGGPYTGFYRSPFSYRYFHPAYGWYPWYDPFWNDASYREVTRYEADAEVFMGRGDKPESPRAYNAREVRINLGTRIQYPVG